MEVARVHEALCTSLVQSFLRYNQRVNVDCLEGVLERIPRQVGRQLKYCHLDPERRIEQIKRALQILTRALLLLPVHSTEAQGLPLGAGSAEKVFKCLFLDIGLMCYLCGLDGATAAATGPNARLSRDRGRAICGTVATGQQARFGKRPRLLLVPVPKRQQCRGGLRYGPRWLDLPA